MNYGEIKKTDIANGVGVRVSLFVSGCTHYCKGCFNKETWNFNYGNPFTSETEEEMLKLISPKFIKGLSILGGDPMEKENQRSLVKFLDTVKIKFPEKDIWCYTGCILDKDLIKGGKYFCEVTGKILSLIDVLVDGPFVEELKNISLPFRGSENQRIIDMNESRKAGKIILYKY